MKKIIILAIVINVFFISVFSQQTYFCGNDMFETVSFTNETLDAAGQTRTLESFQNDTPLVLKVHFWDINMNDGSNPHPITLNKALEAIAELNKNYNTFNIYFKYDGITPINSEVFFNFSFENGDGSLWKDFLRDNNYYKQGAINIYSVDEIVGGTIAFAGTDGNGEFVFIVSEYYAIGPENDPINDFVLTHEVAHNFHLQHVFYCGPAPLYNQCENVIRDPNHPDYNADTHGDKIIDTNATPYPMLHDPENCSYIPNGETDPTGLPYNYNGLEPEVTNFMSYSFPCQSEFTIGQMAYMRWYIEMIDALPEIHALELQPISVLYEPFEGKYRYCGGNGLIHNPRFQPGFNYQFIECRAQQQEVSSELSCPSEYGDHPFIYGEDVYDFDTTISYDYRYREPIIHPNHTAIRIFKSNGDDLVGQPEKCYDAWKKASSGLIKNFVDGVINSNYTVEYLDSIQANSPTLIQDLNNGLYNIEKNYNDGTIDENTILKIDD